MSPGMLRRDMSRRFIIIIIIPMYVHHLSLGLYCILFRIFLISKINIALQLTKLWLQKVTTTTTTTSSFLCAVQVVMVHFIIFQLP